MKISRNIEVYSIRFAFLSSGMISSGIWRFITLAGFTLTSTCSWRPAWQDLLDFGCVFPFEELTINMFLRREYGMDWEIGNYAFGAAAGHPFLHAIIKNCVRAQKDPEWVQPMMTIDSANVS